MSTRFAPGRSRSVWVTLDRPNDRVTTTVATPSTVLKSTLSTSVTSRDVVLVERVDVPGVPVVRSVRVQLQKVARGSWRDHLALGLDVVQRGDQTPLVDGDPDDPVVQDAVLDRHRLAFTDRRRPRRARRRRSRVCGAALKTICASPEPASACWAVAMIASNSAASFAYVASASRCTQEIDEPGRMSWNWFSSTAFQIRSRSSYGYASSLPRHHGRRGPQLGLAEQVLAAPVALLGLGLRGVRRRGAAPGRAHPTRPAHARRTPLRRPRRTRSGTRSSTRGEPSRFATRRAVATNLAGRAATAVAVAERDQRPGRRALLGEVALRVRELAAGRSEL